MTSFRIFLLAFGLLHAGTASAQAEMLPRPWAFGGMTGRVVDAGTDEPIGGVVIVARWNWLEYYPGGIHGGPYSFDEGEVLDIQEVVSDPEGRYRLAAWGPIIRGKGNLEYNPPSVTAFKSGYEPFQKNIGGGDGVIRMPRAYGTPVDLAKRIAAVQRGIYEGGEIHGLHWEYAFPNKVWGKMPRMILALHREKGRLGEAGDKVLGVHLLTGRSGEGSLALPGYRERLLNSKGTPPTPSIVAITWQIRRESDGATRRFVQQKKVGNYGDVTPFFVSPWRYPQPGPPGWGADVDAAPLVRFYAAGYEGSTDRPWTEAGGAIGLRPLPDTREAWLAELRRWRRDIDVELAKGDPAEALEGQRPLIWVLGQECKRLTLDAREGICFESNGPIARLPMPEAMEWYYNENQYGRGDARKPPENPGPPVRLEGKSVTIEKPGEHKPVDGFTIGPAKK